MAYQGASLHEGSLLKRELLSENHQLHAQIDLDESFVALELEGSFAFSARLNDNL